MNGIGIVIFLLIGTAIYIIFRLAKRQLFIRNHKFCPKCGHPTAVIWIDRDVDPREEKVAVGGVRVIRGQVKEYTSRLCCTHCDYEVKI